MISKKHEAELREYFAAFADDEMREIAKANIISNYESERGKILVLTALLDCHIRRLLLARLERSKATSLLFADRGPMDSLYATVLLATALGLLDEKEFADLMTIRKIRNKFAHDVNCSFEMDTIKDRANSLLCGIEEIEVSKLDALSRFVMVCGALNTRIYNRLKSIQQT